MDQVGFWRESYHKRQLLCVRCGSGSVHGRGNLLGREVLDLGNFCSCCTVVGYPSRFWAIVFFQISFLTHAHTQLFYGPFSGTTRVSWCRKKSSGLYGVREDNRGRHTDNPAVWPGPISDPPPSSPIFTPDALPAATFPIYPGLGHAPNMRDCIPSGLVRFFKTDCKVCLGFRFGEKLSMSDDWNNCGILLVVVFLFYYL